MDGAIERIQKAGIKQVGMIHGFFQSGIWKQECAYVAPPIEMNGDFRNDLNLRSLSYLR